MNKFHKTVASILACLMLLTSANFAVLAEEAAEVTEVEEIAAQPEAVILSASNDAEGTSAGILDGINIDWDNYVTESTGTQLTRDYALGLNSDYLYDSLPNDTQGRFDKIRETFPDEVPVFAPYTKAEMAASKTKFYVSPDGSDHNPGTIDEPFKTPERAVRAVNNLASKQGGVTVYFREGVYAILDALVIGNKSGGASEKDLVFYTNYEDEEVTFTGAVTVTGKDLKKANETNDAAFNRKVKDDFKSQIYSVDLSKLGYSSFGTFTRSARPALYVDGTLYTIARWPNAGNTNMAQYTGADGNHGVVEVGDITQSGTTAGTYTGVRGIGIEFQVANPRPFNWENTDNIWFYGYFYAEWAPYHFRIKSWNEQKMTIKSYDYSAYGAKYQKEKNFYYYNILEELDNPGEFFVDTKSGMLYIYPTIDIKDNTLIQLVTTTNDIVTLDNSKYTVFNGITFDMGYDCINMKNGANRNIIQRCKVKNPSRYTYIQDSTTYENGVICSILVGECSMQGLPYATANRRAGNFMQNCYSKRVSINNGEGNIVSHNLVTGFNSMGISTSSGGSERIIEYNETVAGPDVGLDAGLYYSNGSPKNTGNIIRYNFFNRSTIVPRSTPFGIYLDDRTEGTYVYGNVLNEARIYLHAGSNNMIYNNMICKLPNHNALSNSNNYAHTTTTGNSWAHLVMGNSSTRYTKGFQGYYTTSWQSRFPYQYDWQRRMVAHKYNYEMNPSYDILADKEGEFLSSPRENIYKNNVAVGLKEGVVIVSREIDYVNENNYLFTDPSAFEFTDWENGVLDVTAEKLAELAPGVESFKTNAQMGPIFDPALLPEPLVLEELKPQAPMNSDKVKILPTSIILQWNEVFGKSSYTVKLAEDPNFENIILEQETQDEYINLPDLEFGKQYYWTVSTNSWTEKVSKTPSVMPTATFVTYTFDEAINYIELDTVEFDATVKSLENFMEEGFVIEQGSPEAEGYPADMPLYKAGTNEKVLAFIAAAKVKRDEYKLQADLDKYTQEMQKEFWILLEENAIPYVINMGQGSHVFKAEDYRINAAMDVEFQGDTLKISSPNVSNTVGSNIRTLNGGATFAVRVKHEVLGEYTGINIRSSAPVAGGITTAEGYCVIFKGDLIELQRYPKQTGESTSILAEVVNNEKLVKGGEWFDFTSTIKPTSEGVHIVLTIDGETIVDYLDKNAPVSCYQPGYYAFMHQAKNKTTYYSSVEDIASLDPNAVSTAALEKAITAAETFDEELVEGEPSAEPTYKVGSKAKLAAAIEAAKAAVETADSKEAVAAATNALNAVVEDIKKNDANECVYALKAFDLSQWTATSPLATLELEDNNTLALTADEGEGTVLLYNKPLTSKQKMKFKLKYDTVGDWHAIATRHVDKNASHTRSRSYFFVIKPDLIEFQKYEGAGNGEIVVKIPNNEQIIKSGETYDVEVGSVNVDGGVLSTLKINGETIIEYLDSDDPIYDQGYFSIYCHKTLGKVSIGCAE